MLQWSPLTFSPYILILEMLQFFFDNLHGMVNPELYTKWKYIIGLGGGHLFL